MAHTDPDVELWEHLASEWEPVRQYCRAKIAETANLLVAKSSTPNLDSVRELQGRVVTWREIGGLPESMIAYFAKPTIAKETQDDGRERAGGRRARTRREHRSRGE